MTTFCRLPLFSMVNLFYSIKLGVIEDHSNRTRLAKLLKFFSSNSDTEQTTLAEYIERMKEKQEHIYFMAGTNRGEVLTLKVPPTILQQTTISNFAAFQK